MDKQGFIFLHVASPLCRSWGHQMRTNVTPPPPLLLFSSFTRRVVTNLNVLHALTIAFRLPLYRRGITVAPTNVHTIHSLTLGNSLGGSCAPEPWPGRISCGCLEDSAGSRLATVSPEHLLVVWKILERAFEWHVRPRFEPLSSAAAKRDACQGRSRLVRRHLKALLIFA